jgi:hypothetical protein
MRLIGFNFQKMSIEKFSDLPENVKFNLKLDISSIESIKSDILKIKDELIKIDFIYNVLYEPNVAKLELTGNIILAVEPRMARDILREWKDKQSPEDFRLFVFNIILRKSNIKALQLGEEMGLPPHIPLPSLGKDNINKPKENESKENQ